MKYIKSILSTMLVSALIITSGINANALNLSDVESGIYNVQNDVSHESEIGMSMSRTYLDPNMKIKVKDGKAYYTIKFKGANYMKDHKIFVNGSSVNYDVVSRDSVNHTLELGFSANSIEPNIKASMYVEAMGRDVEFGIITKTSTLSLIEKIEESKKEEVKTEVKEEVVDNTTKEEVSTNESTKVDATKEESTDKEETTEEVSNKEDVVEQPEETEKTEETKDVVEETTEEVVKESNDKTSNNTILYLGIGIVAVLAAGLFIMKAKK